MSNQVRIIGGKWRGRKINFPDLPGLRPTPDRVKETLFNWLMYDIQDARCLDAYAGSGALALEALSRGAKTVVLLENAAAVCTALQQTVVQLQATADTTVVRVNAVEWLAHQPVQPFDIVFLDPPFQENLWQATLDQLKQRNWIHAESVIYVEFPSTVELTEALRGWQVLKQKQMGKVKVMLIKTG